MVGIFRFKSSISSIIVNNILSLIIYKATHQGEFPLFNCIETSLANSNVIYGQDDCL
jgi:hypothetical protein